MDRGSPSRGASPSRAGPPPRRLGWVVGCGTGGRWRRRTGRPIGHTVLLIVLPLLSLHEILSMFAYLLFTPVTCMVPRETQIFQTKTLTPCLLRGSVCFMRKERTH